MSLEDHENRGQAEAGALAFGLRGHERLESEVLPAIAKSGTTGYRVYQTLLGGDTGEYWGIMPLSSLAALDGWSIFQGLGAEDAAKLNARATALVESLEVSVTRLDRELSCGLPGLE